MLPKEFKPQGLFYLFVVEKNGYKFKNIIAKDLAKKIVKIYKNKNKLKRFTLE